MGVSGGIEGGLGSHFGEVFGGFGPKRPHDDANMAPKWPQDDSEKALRNQTSTFKRKCRLLRNLRYERLLREVPRGATRQQNDPKKPKDGHKMTARSPKMTPRGPKMAP